MTKEFSGPFSTLLYAVIVTALACIVTVAPASAEETSGGIWSGADISLGAGLAIVPDYEGSQNYEPYPLPLATVKWDSGRSLKLIGNQFRANLVARSIFKAGPAALYVRKRDNVDNDRVDRLRKVDGSLMVGGFFGVNLDRWNGAIQIVQDISDGNDGMLIRLEGGYTHPFSERLSLSGGIFTTWADDDYMESYFTIDYNNNVRSGLKLYNADSGFKDFGLNAAIKYHPWSWGNWSIMGMGSYTRLVGDAGDSPVVDDVGSENQFYIGALGIYNF